MSRTCMVYLHGIGDNIMLSGALKEYCRRHPDERIDLVVLNPGCAAIWRGNPRVDSVTVYPARQPHFWNPVQFYLLHQWVVRRYIKKINHDGKYQRVLFPAIQTLPEIIYHVTGTYGGHKIYRLSRNLGIPPQLYPYDLYTTPEDEIAARKIISKLNGARLAVMHPFSGHAKKRISAKGIDEIIRTLRDKNWTPLIVGAESERAQLDPNWKVESRFGIPLGVLIEILKRAEVFAGTDSAVAHLAAFADTSRLMIFSPKLEPRRYLPISEHGRVSIIRVKQGEETRSLEDFRKNLEAP